jgi:hypothetical protein
MLSRHVRPGKGLVQEAPDRPEDPSGHLGPIAASDPTGGRLAKTAGGAAEGSPPGASFDSRESGRRGLEDRAGAVIGRGRAATA